MALRDHDPRQEDQIIELRNALVRTQRKLARAQETTDHLVTATVEACRDAVLAQQPYKIPKKPKKDHRADPEHAVWHLTDWQGAKVTSSYNSRVMRERVEKFCKKAERITYIQRAHHPVEHLTIMYGGDMIEGLFNYPSQPYEIDATLFEQFVTVARLIADVSLFALEHFRTVHVVPEWGNHGRLGSKRAVVPRSDNADRMTYELARNLVTSDRLTWQDCPEDIQRVEIGNYRALLIHGDEVGRNGFASPMTLVRHTDRWASGAYSWDFRDVYIGHYHTHAEWAMANGHGAVYQTGSIESDNRYARDTMAASAVPSQRIHFIDPVEGRVTSQYKVYVD
jgi:hypothetical protein